MRPKDSRIQPPILATLVDIFGLERSPDVAPSSGLGLLLGESRDLAAALSAMTPRPTQRFTLAEPL